MLRHILMLGKRRVQLLDVIRVTLHVITRILVVTDHMRHRIHECRYASGPLFIQTHGREFRFKRGRAYARNCAAVEVVAQSRVDGLRVTKTRCMRIREIS